MALAAPTTAVTITVIAIAVLRRFGLLNACGGAVCCTGSTVIGGVARFIPASVACGKMLVSISVAADVEPSRAVPASLPSDEESPTSAVPSTRQKTSASSVSMRLHWGQRFIFGAL